MLSLTAEPLIIVERIFYRDQLVFGMVIKGLFLVLDNTAGYQYMLDRRMPKVKQRLRTIQLPNTSNQKKE